VSEGAIPVTVQILDKEYRIACQSDEREDLLKTSHFLDQKMREIRDSGKVLGSDRIAVMAALNLAHELLQQKSEKETGQESVTQKIQAIQDKIESTLEKTKQLEL
jgi:cell division protein ZapA